MLSELLVSGNSGVIDQQRVSGSKINKKKVVTILDNQIIINIERKIKMYYYY